jgi:hypothetical protein
MNGIRRGGRESGDETQKGVSWFDERRGVRTGREYEGDQKMQGRRIGE